MPREYYNEPALPTITLENLKSITPGLLSGQGELQNQLETQGVDAGLATGQTSEQIEQDIANSTNAQNYAESQELDILEDTTADDTTVDDTVTTDSLDTGERLYDYVNQREEGGSQNLYWNNYDRKVTLDELRDLYNAPDNARIRESFGTFDNYLAYMDERQDLIDSGDYKADWWDTGVALVDVEGLGREGGMDDWALEKGIMQEGARQGEIGYNEQKDVFERLYEKYTGESVVKYLDNGARYEWNGSSFVLTQEAFGFDVVGAVFKGLPAIVLSAGLAGPLAGALANATGAATVTAAHTAAASGIVNAATQLASTGQIDFKQALLSTALNYGGSALQGAIAASSEVNGVLSQVTNQLNKFEELISGGNDIASAAIRAGGVSMLTQLVTREK